MANYDNTENIKELVGLPGLTIEGYSGDKGNFGSNVFLCSKTEPIGTYLIAGVDTDNDTTLDEVWYIKTTTAYENDFVLLNEYNTLSTYIIKTYTEDSSGNSNYIIPSWMRNSLSTDSNGEYLILEYVESCTFNISSVNYRNSLDVTVTIETIDNTFTGWDFTYPESETSEVYSSNINDNSIDSLTLATDKKFNIVKTSNPNTIENVSRTFLKFSYSASPVNSRNMKIVAQFTQNTDNNIKNATPDSVVYDKAISNDYTRLYTEDPVPLMGYIPNYDSSINFDNEDLGDFMLILKSYTDDYSSEDCGIYIPYEKLENYIIEIYVYLQSQNGIEEKIYFGQATL